MIPESALPDASQLEDVRQPSLTYRLDPASKRIVGMVDGLEAVTQAVYKILCTERYAWLIYDWEYGVELEQYLGADYNFVVADITGSISEALLVDDRVQSVQDFVIHKTGIDSLYVEFLVVSNEGSTRIGREVSI